MYLQIFVSSFIVFLTLFFLFKKSRLLNDNVETSKHKKLVFSKNSPIIIGGIYLLIIIFFYFPDHLLKLKIIGLLILSLGLFSDKNVISNPTTRLIIQIIILFSFVLIEDLYIKSISVQILDDLLSNHIFNIFFTVFCFAILINGSNFLDGLNILTSGYFLLVLIFLIFLNSQFDIRFDYIDEVKILTIALSIFVFFNLFGYCYLGDGGVYLLSTIIGFILINLFNSNIYISPYFIVLLLWYPAFENLFSLTRRLYLKTKVSNPDKLHLHQLIYRYFILKKIFNKKILNSFTSLIILIYNLLIFSISIKYYFHTKTLLALIILNLIIYILLYNFLSKKFVSKK